MTHRSKVYGEAMSMLDGLPEGSVVLDVDGDAWQKQDVRWTSVARGANTELMGSNSLAILTPLTVVYRPDVALAVFEKAHTPTYDEREALTLIVRDVHNYDGRPGYLALHGADAGRIADAILAAGFRRSEVPEPSARLATSAEQELAKAHSSERDAGDNQVSECRENQEHGEIISDDRAEPSDAAARALAIHDAWGTPNDPDGKVRPTSDYTNLSARMAQELRKGNTHV